MTQVKKELKAIKAANKNGDKDAKAAHKKTALKLLDDMEKEAKNIPDDDWKSIAGRIAFGIAGVAAYAVALKAVSVGKLANAGAIAAGGVAGTGMGTGATVLVDLITAKNDGKKMSEISRHTVMEAIRQMKHEVKDA